MTDYSSKVVVCIGAGYVGGPTMAVLAKHCEEVEFHVVDINAQRIAEWNSDTLPIYEPGLDTLIKHVCVLYVLYDGLLIIIIIISPPCVVGLESENTSVKFFSFSDGKKKKKKKIGERPQLVLFH